MSREERIAQVEALCQQRDYKAALKELNGLRDEFPKDEQVLLYMGRCLDSLKHFDRAYKAYRKVVAINPHRVDVWKKITMYEKRTHKEDKLRASYESILAIPGLKPSIRKRIELNLKELQPVKEEVKAMHPYCGLEAVLYEQMEGMKGSSMDERIEQWNQIRASIEANLHIPSISIWQLSIDTFEEMVLFEVFECDRMPLCAHMIYSYPNHPTASLWVATHTAYHYPSIASFITLEKGVLAGCTSLFPYAVLIEVSRKLDRNSSFHKYVDTLASLIDQREAEKGITLKVWRSFLSVRKGIIAASLGKVEEARSHYLLAQEMNESSYEGFYYHCHLVYPTDPALAIEVLGNAPDHPLIHLLRGRCFHMVEELDKALECFGTVDVEGIVDHKGLYYQWLGLLYLSKGGKYTSAKEYALTALLQSLRVQEDAQCYYEVAKLYDEVFADSNRAVRYMKRAFLCGTVEEGTGRAILARLKALNRVEDAIQLLEAIGEKLAVSAHWSRKVLAELYLLKGDTDAATRVIQLIVRFHPEDLEMWYKLGQGYFKAGKYAAALRSFQEVTRLDPQHENASRYIGLLYQVLGQTDEALAVYDTMLSTSTYLPALKGASDCHITLARRRVSDGRYKEAHRHALMALESIEKALSHCNYLDSLYKTKGDALMLLVRLPFSSIQSHPEEDPQETKNRILRSIQAATACYERVLEGPSGGSRGLYDISVSLLYQHRYGGEEGTITRAKAYMHTCLQGYPYSSKSWTLLGNIYAALAQDEVTKFCFQVALLLEPTNTDAWSYYGKYVLEQGDREEAMHAVYTAKIHNAEHVLPWLLEAIIAQEEGNTVLSYRSFAHVFELGKYRKVDYALGYAYVSYKMKEFDTATEAIRRVLAYETKDTLGAIALQCILSIFAADVELTQTCVKQIEEMMTEDIPIDRSRMIQFIIARAYGLMGKYDAALERLAPYQDAEGDLLAVRLRWMKGDKEGAMESWERIYREQIPGGEERVRFMKDGLQMSYVVKRALFDELVEALIAARDLMLVAYSGILSANEGDEGRTRLCIACLEEEVGVEVDVMRLYFLLGDMTGMSKTLRLYPDDTQMIKMFGKAMMDRKQVEGGIALVSLSDTLSLTDYRDIANGYLELFASPDSVPLAMSAGCKAVKIDPTCTQSWFILLRAHYRAAMQGKEDRGKVAKLMDDTVKAKEVYELAEHERIILGAWSLHLKGDERSLQVIERLYNKMKGKLEGSPEDPFYHASIVVTSVYMRMLVESGTPLETIEEMAECYPECSSIHVEVGYQFYVKGGYAKARAILRRQKARNPFAVALLSPVEAALKAQKKRKK